MDQLLKSTPGFPKVGWQWLSATDLHDDEGRSYGDYDVCQFCGKEQIRFVHHLQHPHWTDTIAVGRICASDLSGDSRVDSQERILRNRAQRRANFIRLKSWKTSAKGNYWIEYQGHHIVVMRRPNGMFRLQIDGEFGKLTFPDKNTAMARAFDVVAKRIDSGR